VAFRERVTERVEHSYTHKKQTGYRSVRSGLLGSQ
jgi:hypothetical protein